MSKVSDTMVIPLYGRKLCSELYPELFKDEAAERLVATLDYDFSDIEKKANSAAMRFGALEVACRQTDLGLEVLDYLKAHPNAAVVNLGCGLDKTAQTFQKIIDGMNLYTAEEITAALKTAGFSKVECTHHKKNPWIAVVATK